MKETYNLFLDDIRVPGDVTWIKLPTVEWHIVRNYEEFIHAILTKGIPAFVTYDHDLSDQHYTSNQNAINYNKFREKTGYECAQFLVNQCMNKGIKHPRFAVHSMNPVGRQNIVSYINSYNRTFSLP
jgi:hypothetical protein